MKTARFADEMKARRRADHIEEAWSFGEDHDARVNGIGVWASHLRLRVGWWTAHLTGATAPVFRGPSDRRWWHVALGDGAASWTMDVRVDEITGVRFVREPYPFPSFLEAPSWPPLSEPS
jgi:hypothetical protein